MTLIALMSCAEVASASGPGSFDLSFGQGGIALSPLPSVTSDPRLIGIAADAAGRIVVASAATIDPAGGETGFSVTRLLPDGRLDASFGDKGFVTLQFAQPMKGSPASSFATPVAIEPDGGIVVAGAVLGPAGVELGLARLDASGRPRWIKTHRISNGARPTAVALGPDDTVMVAADGLHPGTVGYLIVARMRLADGELDPTYAGTGFVQETISEGPPDDECSLGVVHVTALELLPSGSTVAGGRLNRRCYDRRYMPTPLLRIYRPDGTRDASVVAPSGMPTIARLAALADGTLYAAGGWTSSLEPPSIVRFTPPALAEKPFPGESTGLAIDAAGRPVMAMRADNSRVIRYQPDLTQDRSFGTRGSAPAGLDDVSWAGLQPDGRILVAGFDGQSMVFRRLLAGPARSRIRIARTVRTGAERRAARVRLACRGGGTGAGCTGTVSVRTRSGRKLGSAAYALERGDERMVRVLLRRTARRAFLRVRVTNEFAPTARRLAAVRR